MSQLDPEWIPGRWKAQLASPGPPLTLEVFFSTEKLTPAVRTLGGGRGKRSSREDEKKRPEVDRGLPGKFRGRSSFARSPAAFPFPRGVGAGARAEGTRTEGSPSRLRLQPAPPSRPASSWPHPAARTLAGRFRGAGLGRARRARRRSGRRRRSRPGTNFPARPHARHGPAGPQRHSPRQRPPGSPHALGPAGDRSAAPQAPPTPTLPPSRGLCS